MQPFDYRAPTDLDEALDLLAAHGSDAKLLAGGQSLLVLLRQRLIAPVLVVDLKRVGALRPLVGDGVGLRIGATVRHAELATAPIVRERWPLLATAAGSIGSIHIRARGTIGGSIAHADPAADLLVALIAMDGRVAWRTRTATHSCDAADVATGMFETRLPPDAAVTAIRVPPQPLHSTTGYARFALREGEFPMCQAAIRLTWNRDRCTDARVAVGGAAERPLRLTDVEAMLTGPPLDADGLRGVVEQAQLAVRPFGDVRGSADWKRRVAGAVVGRAIRHARDARAVFA